MRRIKSVIGGATPDSSASVCRVRPATIRVNPDSNPIHGAPLSRSRRVGGAGKTQAPPREIRRTDFHRHPIPHRQNGCRLPVNTTNHPRQFMPIGQPHPPRMRPERAHHPPVLAYRQSRNHLSRSPIPPCLASVRCRRPPPFITSAIHTPKGQEVAAQGDRYFMFALAFI
jgi:hypothetical protein